MSISDRMKNIATNVQEGVKASSVSTASVVLRLISGVLLGLTLGLIGQELVGYGPFLLIFVSLVILGIFMRLSSSWRISQVLIFDLICVLVAQLLRMYILLAP